MIAFKFPRVVREVEFLEPRLWEILCWLNGEWQQLTGHEIMLVTDLYRPREETVEIYVAAGETPPRVSVHEVKPCRGADVAVRVPAGDGRWEQLSFGTARAIEGAVNAAWRYQESEAHQVALFHDIAGAHIHLQCRPGDETRRR